MSHIISTSKVSLSIFTLSITVLSFGLTKIFPSSFQTSLWYIPSVFFCVFGFFTQSYLVNAIYDENKNKFTFRFLIATALKLFSGLIMLIIFRFVDTLHFKGFAILFLIQYLLFTIYEIFFLFKELRKPSR